MGRRAWIGLLLAGLAAACAGPAPDGDALTREATVAWRQGRLEDALEVTGRGSRALRRTGDVVGAARIELQRAEVLVARRDERDLQEAAHLIAGAFEVALEHPELLPRCSYLRAYAASKGDDDTDSVLAAIETAILQAQEAGDAAVHADALLLRFQVLRRERRLDDARRSGALALAIAREAGDRFRSAAARLNLGRLDMNLGRYEEAIETLEHAIDDAEADGADLPRATAQLNLTICRWRVGDVERALRELADAIELFRRSGLRVYLSEGLGTRGQMLLSRGEPRAALESLEAAIPISRDLGHADDEALWSLGAARAWLALGDAERARRWIERAGRAYREDGDVRGLAGVTLCEGELAAAEGDESRAIELFERATAAVPDFPEVVWAARAGAARALRRLGRIDEARRQFGEAIAAVEEGRDRLDRDENRISFLTEPIEIYRDYVAMLLEQGLEDDALRVIESSRARALFDDDAQVEPVGVNDLVALAGDHQVTLISYWISPRGSFAWLFDADGERRVTLDGLDTLDADVDRFTRTLVDGWRDPLDSGEPLSRRLYDRLVRPLRDWLPAGTRAIVVPDGPLAALNPESLVVDGERGEAHYLIEELPLAVAPSLTALATAGRRDRPATPSVLLVGDPDEVDPAFPALPHAAAELDAIARQLAGFELVALRGERATPAAVLASPIARVDWLHFAAHAQASAVAPLESSIILASDGNDHRLRGRDIARGTLSAELVTLSACRSAGSRSYAGEGRVGLAWAFMRAGASRVVAGLWDVSDRSTVTLMEEMYAGLARGRSPGESLRTAKLNLLRSAPGTSRPFYWAPFQLYTRDPDF